MGTEQSQNRLPQEPRPKTPREKFEDDYGYTRLPDAVRFPEGDKELQAEAFELTIKPGDTSPAGGRDRARAAKMILDARAAGYHLIGTCSIPGVVSPYDEHPLTAVQVYLERPAPGSSVQTSEGRSQVSRPVIKPQTQR